MKWCIMNLIDTLILIAEEIFDMENKHPKVFISYSWGDDTYNNKVIAFVKKLSQDGIHVIFDRNSLKVGHDTYAFMEKMVIDNSINYVLILINKTYSDKANKKMGGVGTETQIISSELYSKVEQTKFIPVIFERDNGLVQLPVYLKNRKYIDLSLIDSYPLEYQKLVRMLYNEKELVEFKIGNKPNWVSNPTICDIEKDAEYRFLKQKIERKVKQTRFKEFLNELLIDFENENASISNSYNSYPRKIKKLRDDFLLLLTYSSYVFESVYMISNFLEKLVNLSNKKRKRNEQLQVLANELVIYIVAFYLKYDLYKEIGLFLSTKHFSINKDNNIENCCLFNIYQENRRNNESLVLKVSTYIFDNINEKYFVKEDLIFADLIIFNYTIINFKTKSEIWFPILYHLESENQYFILFSKKIQDKQVVRKYLEIFSCENAFILIDKLKHVQEISLMGELLDFKYSTVFEFPELILDYFDLKKLIVIFK